MVERIADLREPPVVGRWYMVPVIRDYPWHGRSRDWPVLGQMHEDAEFFNFRDLHYHVDARFIGARDASYILRAQRNRFMTGDREIDLGLAASASPLCYRGVALPKGRPTLKRLRCARASFDGQIRKLALSVMDKMGERYGDPAPAIVKPDGRRLCPHRKVDLSQFPANDQGIVVCPIHGLRVCVRGAA